jgi:hypothetical protein
MPVTLGTMKRAKTIPDLVAETHHGKLALLL